MHYVNEEYEITNEILEEGPRHLYFTVSLAIGDFIVVILFGLTMDVLMCYDRLESGTPQRCQGQRSRTTNVLEGPNQGTESSGSLISVQQSILMVYYSTECTPNP